MTTTLRQEYQSNIVSIRYRMGSIHRCCIRGLFDPPPLPSPNPVLHSRGRGGGTRLIINYPPALPRKAIAITCRSRGQGDQPANGFALFPPPFLPPSLPPLPPSHSEIYFVRARGWRTMRELGKCVTRLLTLFIFARRNTPGHHAALQHPGAERIGLSERRGGMIDILLRFRATLTRKTICRL